MIPKKIYLNYVDEDDDEKTWSEEPVSVTDCDLQSREYTDLSQVWHPASEPPQEIDAQIICNAASLTCPEGMTYVETTLRGIMHISSSWQDWARRYRLKAWAYLEDLLPPGSWPEFPDD